MEPWRIRGNRIPPIGSQFSPIPEANQREAIIVLEWQKRDGNDRNNLFQCGMALLAVGVKSRDSIKETLEDRSEKKTHAGLEEEVDEDNLE